MIATASFCALAAVATADGRGDATASAHEVVAPATCDGPQVRRLVVAFVAAFNSGSKAQLDALWAQVGFRWYSVTRSKKEHYVSYSRANVLRYFAARHKRAETLALKSFRFNGAGGDYRHFQYTLTRRANDIARGAREAYIGKGAAVCLNGRSRLAVWSMGRPEPD
ncbi:MAG TPA: hypothetical protein VNP93_10845 [Gaiellaceae bacterium]|nr:hypothetical protein [Gaiellaceae bacterium]